MTNISPVEEGKSRGMAPLAFRIVRHGIYTMPFFVTPTVARRSGCTAQDVELLLHVIPHTYANTASHMRSQVNVRHAWYAVHKSPLGSCPEHLISEALTPQRIGDDPMEPSRTWADYTVPQGLPSDLRERLADFRDLALD
jgi:CRISPR/Cas system type I-B associated protein Csh2 (Cas7 group RAMP superfamily)